MSLTVLHDGALFVEDSALSDIAGKFGTPCYVYSRAALTAAFEGYRDALGGRDARVCYAVKANSNLAILNLFAGLGAWFDIVSGGELARVMAARGDPAKVIFSGVGKTRGEMCSALEAGIHCFNVESESELRRLDAEARLLGRRAPVSLRVNPDVDARTHPYISTGLKTSKFGVAFDEALPLYRLASSLPHIAIRGIDCHIGSQMLDSAPAAEAAAKLAALVDRLKTEGIAIAHMDLGGGMGIRYRDEEAPAAAEYLADILKPLDGRSETLMFEPGRSLVGNAGLLLTRVEALKHGTERNFAVVDAAMNDLLRPALYDAWHDIVAVEPRGESPKRYEVVGPICESGDFLGHDRDLALREGDLLAVLSTGAYGMAMASNYNSRPRAAEVMVCGAKTHLIRRREDVAQLFDSESILP